MRNSLLVIFSACLLSLAGCTKARSSNAQATNDTVAPVSSSDSASSPAPPPAPQLVVPAGTSFRVRLLETVGTRRNRAGDRFTASLDEALVDGDRVAVPKGTEFTGHIVESKPSGRFKGHAVLALRLDSFNLNGQVYQITSTDASRASAGHLKRNVKFIGGGSGGGALIGAAAAGGPGALIGAGAGAAAGAAGSIITGKRQVTLPAETVLRFSLSAPVSVT